MQGPKQLLASEDRWVTKMGAWFPGERVVFRGKDMFHELKDISWLSLLMYGITSRRLNPRQLRLFEGVWTLCISYPDPRLWNNRVVALAGTARSTATLAISAATAVSEASIYGQRPNIRSIDFLLRTRKRLDDGEKLETLVKSELQKHRVIAGYGRPVTRQDERIKPIMDLAEKLGFAKGPFVKLAFEIETVLLQGRWRMHMNIAALIAALAADQNLSPQEYQRFMVLGFSGGMFPCYVDSVSKKEGSFFPLRCQRICYEGAGQRNW